MATRDSRSYKVVFVPDYVLNPENYPDLPQHMRIYEGIRGAGYGIVKLPRVDIPEECVPAWIDMAVDMMEEYLRKGYAVAVITVEGLPDEGVWLNTLMSKIKARNAPTPKVIKVTKRELEKGGEELTLKIKSIF